MNRRMLAALAGVVTLLLVAAQPLFAAIDPTRTTETKITASDGAAGDVFGRVSGSLSISGQTAVVGAYLADPLGDSSGAAYIFQKSAGTWGQQAKLVPSDGVPKDLFGQAVSIDGDVVVIGAFMADPIGSHSGAAYVFRRSSGVWSQEAKLVPTDGVEADMFGYSVSVYGNTAVVGAPFTDARGLDSGSVYVFVWNGSSWVQTAKLLASDGVAGDRFGDSVSIAGNVVLVGATYADAGYTDSGAAYAFRWNGASWVQEAKLVASDRTSGDLLGFSVSVNLDTAVAGAYGKGPGNNRGAAYVFRWNGTAWSQEAKLTASDGSVKDDFGFSVSISSDLIVVGAVNGDDGVRDTGAAYVYSRSGSTWTEQGKLLASDGALYDAYGESVFIYGNTAIIGAPKGDDKGLDSGSAYIYDLFFT